MKYDVEIAVVGAGPAGIAAACVAAEHGNSVAIIDDNFAAGGQIWRGDHDKEDHQISSEASRWFQCLHACKSVTHVAACRVFDAPEPGVLHADCDGSVVEIHYKRLILATGARERFLPFPGWTLPNVMGAGALQAMVKSGLPITNKRVVVCGTGPLLLAVAAYLRARGAIVVGIFEQANWTNLARFAFGIAFDVSRLRQGLHYKWKTRGIPFHAGCWPISACGRNRIETVTFSDGAKQWNVPCDYLACGFHLVPNIELASLLGCRIEHRCVLVDSLQQTSVPSVFCAGEPTGIGGLELSLIEGQIAGLAASSEMTTANDLARRRRRILPFADLLAKTFALRPALRRIPQPDTIICRCEDVPLESLSPHDSWRSAKLHTRCGMGPCQGRICGTALEFLLGWQMDLARMPISPTSIGNLATPIQTAAQNIVKH